MNKFTLKNINNSFITKYTDVSNNTYYLKFTIDTIYLVLKLIDAQRQIIYDRFRFNKNRPDWHWHYSQLETSKLGFSLHALPTNTYQYRHYDHVIQLQNEITTSEYIPSSLSEILESIDWNIKRIDMAVDFMIPQAKSLVWKHHGLVQFDEHEELDTKYLGKLQSRSPSKLAFYNRNDKEAERQTGIEHEYPNRFEIRMFPKSNDSTMKLHTMQDDFIIKHLSKYIIIPNIDDLPISQWDKNKLYKIKNNYTYLATLDKKKQKELKAICTAHRVPLEQLYLHNKDNLFRFMQPSEYEEVEPLQDELIMNDIVPAEIYQDEVMEELMELLYP